MNEEYQAFEEKQEDMDRDTLLDTDDITYDDEAVGLPNLSREEEKRANIAKWKEEFIKED
jgi:hypothetical protein